MVKNLNIYCVHLFSDVFVRSVVPEPIWLVLVLDQSDVSKTQLLLGQQVARLLLASLSEKDRVGLVLASDTVRLPVPPSATNEQLPGHASRLDLFPAVHETKLVRSSGFAVILFCQFSSFRSFYTLLIVNG